MYPSYESISKDPLGLRPTSRSFAEDVATSIRLHV